MSGHAEDVLTHEGILEPLIDLLPKPFLPQALIAKVAGVLEPEHSLTQEVHHQRIATRHL
jgi:hypothetical protein